MIPTPQGSGRERILYLLKTLGPCTVARLARRLRVTPMAVRQHLAGLQAENLVEFGNEKRKVGRPPQVWRLARQASTYFPDHHAELAMGLLAAVRGTLGEEGLRRIGKLRVRRQVEAYRARMPGPGAPLAARVAALARLRRKEGYMAAWERRGPSHLEIVENHCSIAAAASFCPGLCQDELSLFRAVLGNEVEVDRTDHILSGYRCCRYRITPRPRKRAGLTSASGEAKA